MPVRILRYLFLCMFHTFVCFHVIFWTCFQLRFPIHVLLLFFLGFALRMKQLTFKSTWWLTHVVDPGLPARFLDLSDWIRFMNLACFVRFLIFPYGSDAFPVVSHVLVSSWFATTVLYMVPGVRSVARTYLGSKLGIQISFQKQYFILFRHHEVRRWHRLNRVGTYRLLDRLRRVETYGDTQEVICFTVCKQANKRVTRIDQNGAKECGRSNCVNQPKWPQNLSHGKTSRSQQWENRQKEEFGEFYTLLNEWLNSR